MAVAVPTLGVKAAESGPVVVLKFWTGYHTGIHAAGIGHVHIIRSAWRQATYGHWATGHHHRAGTCAGGEPAGPYSI
ncbi:MAG: hypothetical protein U5L96_03175 [Owenweeksia sp.]|nr:hypothetical protein [Owenweeksia sp.]